MANIDNDKPKTNIAELFSCARSENRYLKVVARKKIDKIMIIICRIKLFFLFQQWYGIPDSNFVIL